MAKRFAKLFDVHGDCEGGTRASHNFMVHATGVTYFIFIIL